MSGSCCHRCVNDDMKRLSDQKTRNEKYRNVPFPSTEATLGSPRRFFVSLGVWMHLWFLEELNKLPPPPQTAEEAERGQPHQAARGSL